jgi:hypothetical protein
MKGDAMNKNQELIAAGIRRQMENLAQVAHEIQLEPLAPEAIAWRLRAIELGLRRLREAA